MVMIENSSQQTEPSLSAVSAVPIGRLIALKNTIMIIATHPDDELLGYGGTLIKDSKNGDTIKTLKKSF